MNLVLTRTTEVEHFRLKACMEQAQLGILLPAVELYTLISKET